MMKKITMIALIVLTALLGTQTNAQNGGDDCAGAVIVVPGIFTDTTITDNIPGNNNGDAAWFSYTASSDGFITVNSGIDIDTPDTRVFIYDNCTDLTELESDDDGGPGFTSTISDFPVTSGTEYIIAWDDRWEVDPFDWELSFGTCLDATNFVGIAGQTDVSFTWTDNPLATNGYSVAVYIAGADPDVDMPVVPAIITAQGDMTADLMGLTELTNYDAYIISDCDANGFSNGDNVFSFTTSETPGPNATCDSALVITPDLYNATIVDASPGTDNGDSIWYSFTPTEDGTVTVSACFGDDNDDTRVFMSQGSCDALIAVADDDDGCGDPTNTFSSLLTGIPVVTGIEYFIQWDDRWSTDEFEWELMFEGTQTQMCDTPENLAVSNIGSESADFSWDIVADAFNGYTVVVYNEGDDPTDTAIVPISQTSATTNATVTGLEELTNYEAYVFTNCDGLDSELSDVAVAFTTVEILGFDDNSLLNISILPNPTTGIVTLNTTEQIQSLAVYSILGQEVLTMNPTATSFEINLSNVAAGTYFVKATSNGTTSVQKIIKE